MSITVGLSRGSGTPKYENYWRWLRSYDPDVRIIDLYESESLADDLAAIDALVLTGGGDIHPEIYGHPEFEELCTGIDTKRDDVEAQAFDFAVEHKVPVLGVCRGLQFINVHLKGTLTPHLPATIGENEYHTAYPDRDKRHDVEVVPGSLLYRTIHQLSGEVNSSHHQAIDELGEGLAVTARSPDGIVEAIEWQEPENQAFMIAIQWHPERMERHDSFSEGLLDRLFLEGESARIFKATTPPAPKEEPDEIDPENLSSDDDDEGSSLFPIIKG